jgi:hypothetical protein
MKARGYTTATGATVRFFMNTFKTLGLLAYNGGLHVHSSLLTIVRHDSLPFYLLTITQG